MKKSKAGVAAEWVAFIFYIGLHYICREYGQNSSYCEQQLQVQSCTT